MFKPLSDALALVLALSLAEPSAERPVLDADHSTMETRWGPLAIIEGSTSESVTLDGAPILGLEAAALWIVRVESISPVADRAVIGAADDGEWLPTRFSAVTITESGARIERGGILLDLAANR